MPDSTQPPAGDVEAREAAPKEAIDVYNFGATNNAKNFRDPVAFRAAINHAIDRYLAKLTPAKAEPSRIAEDVAWLRAQAVSTAKAMTMLQDHRTADYKARGDLDANYKGIEPHETREWNLANRLEILLSHITAIEADRDRMRELLKDVCEPPRLMAPAAPVISTERPSMRATSFLNYLDAMNVDLRFVHGDWHLTRRDHAYAR